MGDLQTITVEGQITAVDTLTALTTFGAETPTRRVDDKGTHIRQISCNFSADGAAVGAAVFGIKLSGDGIKRIQRFFIGAIGGQLATTSQTALESFAFNTSMIVSGGNVITVEATMAGADLGTATVGISMIVADGSPPADMWYASVEGTATAVDTLTAMTTFGADTGLGPINVLQNAKQIVREWVVSASNSAAVGEENAFVRIFGQGLIRPGNFDFDGPAYGGTLNTSNIVATLPSVHNMVLAVTANQISCQTQLTGIDTGEITSGITLEVQM